MWQFLEEEMRNNLAMKRGRTYWDEDGGTAAVLAMICLTTGFTGLSGLIWTGAQQQRVYDDLIRQTKRESVLLSRTKNGGENGSVQRTRVSVEELQERRLEQANTGNKAAGSATGGQKHRGRLENQQTAKQAQTKQTVIDFDALKKINPDVVSWITIPGTNIDYPLLQGKDNNQYLHTKIWKEETAPQVPFSWITVTQKGQIFPAATTSSTVIT